MCGGLDMEHPIAKNLTFFDVEYANPKNLRNKSKKAIEYNSKGCNIQIVKEVDFLLYKKL